MTSPRSSAMPLLSTIRPTLAGTSIASNSATA
jgi:hypothetical protein